MDVFGLTEEAVEALRQVWLRSWCPHLLPGGVHTVEARGPPLLFAEARPSTFLSDRS